MRIKIHILLLAAIVPMVFGCGDHNPLITALYTADPSIHRWSDGRFYLYCSHDRDDAEYFDMDDYHVFSSDDLLHWTDHGVALSAADTPWEGFLWAPDCAEKEGRYFLYFPQGPIIGVAESLSPTGPFFDVGLVLDTEKENGIHGGSVDPAVFREGGTWYLLFKDRVPVPAHGKPYTLRFNIAELSGDMRSLVPGSRSVIETLDGPPVHEGPYLFKRGKTYYLLSCGRQTYYFRSESLRGPYCYGGLLIDDGPGFPSTMTQHNSVIHVGEAWILFWHYEDGSCFRRRVGADYMRFRADGTIETVVPTKKGIDGV